MVDIQKYIQDIKLGTPHECPIWGAGHECWSVPDPQPRSDYRTYYSSRAGGLFRIEGLVNLGIDHAPTDLRLKLSRAVYDDSRQGIISDLTQITIDNIDNRSKLTIHSRLDRLLSCFVEFPLSLPVGVPFGDNKVIENHNLMMSATECVDKDEFIWILEAAQKRGWLEYREISNVSKYWRITPDGLAHLEAKQVDRTYSSQAFVAMWFGDDMEDVYEKGIDLGVRDAGYEPYRVDKDASFGDQITDQIFYEIDRSRFLIADFTHGDSGARGGVYFEAGYAKGKDMQIIWCIKDGHLDQLHFDTNHYPHVVWKNAADLREKLKDKIRAYIGEGPLGSGSGLL